MEHYRRSIVAVIIVLVVILACGGVYHLVTHNVHASLGYCLEARFKAFPENDKAIKAWILSQPDIVSNTVCVGRFDDDKRLLAVCFTQVQNMAGEPPIPDLDAACKRLGYTNPDGPFRDSADRGRMFTEP
jgi:hypothetical protein